MICPEKPDLFHHSLSQWIASPLIQMCKHGSRIHPWPSLITFVCTIPQQILSMFPPSSFESIPFSLISTATTMSKAMVISCWPTTRIGLLFSGPFEAHIWLTWLRGCSLRVEPNLHRGLGLCTALLLPSSLALISSLSSHGSLHPVGMTILQTFLNSVCSTSVSSLFLLHIYLGCSPCDLSFPI